MTQEGKAAAGACIRLVQGQDVDAADTLMANTGDGVRIIPVLRAAIENGSAASTRNRR